MPTADSPNKALMDSHESWVERVSTACRDNILGFDPDSQVSMRFHRDPWLRWNKDDADLSRLLDDYLDGIHRRDLKALAKDLTTPAKRRAAFVATLLWGAGPTNRYYGRHSKALKSNELEDILEKSVLQIQSNDLEGAWSTTAKLPGLGFRFFTKWLWLAGADAELPAPPLVFDQRVLDSLQVAHWPFDHRRTNARGRWVSYCHDSAAVANQLSQEPKAPNVTSEWVEYWLFSGAPGAERLSTMP